MIVYLKSTLDAIEDLKSNNTEVRLDKLEIEIDRIDTAVTNKMKMVQESFDDMKERSVTEVPKEIVSSIQEVINDSAPGFAMESIREEIGRWGIL